ncbi:hypothetical protein SISSUDRAFT_1066967 [Sistotremastrum suecicum HHB10207 ss-3]|uniref:Uncharacterized protein n=1 Tax=Sistotremastrum suecicum HHB10207 ss-3 TaxID=1314776 RepID=A0A165XPC0_9AGAM|nr:hypothetical protein SISSUDRAFT_1066967 [Sistotremastrum suecicum HHB10207 ss-3]
MHLGKSFVSPTFPQSYGSGDYHASKVAYNRLDSRSLLGLSPWIKTFYDYASVVDFLKDNSAGLSLNTLTSRQCAMQRAGILHGAASGLSHLSLTAHPSTYIRDKDWRRQAGAELTEMAFDSLAGVDRTTGALTLSIVMHGELVPGQQYTPDILREKLSIWTGDSVLHNRQLCEAWGAIIDEIVERIAMPWQAQFDVKMGGGSRTPRYGSQTASPSPKSPVIRPSSILEDWGSVHASLPSTPHRPLRNPVTPSRAPLHSISPAITPASSPTKPTPAMRHRDRFGESSRVAGESQVAVPPFEFSPKMAQVLSSVGWHVTTQSNWEALEKVYDAFLYEPQEEWPETIMHTLELPGTLVMRVYNAAVADLGH